jgi:hypothetical protein
MKNIKHFNFINIFLLLFISLHSITSSSQVIDTDGPYTISGQGTDIEIGTTYTYEIKQNGGNIVNSSVDVYVNYGTITQVVSPYDDPYITSDDIDIEHTLNVGSSIYETIVDDTIIIKVQF